MADIAGLRVASTADFSEGVVDPDKLGDANAVLMQELGVAVVDTPPEELRALSSAAAAESSSILAVEPERIVYAMQDQAMFDVAPPAQRLGPMEPPRGSLDYFLGYRDAINQLVARMAGGTAAEEAGTIPGPVLDEVQFTWGLQVTNVPASQYSGRGIRVAVLDTGMDLQHPDFLGRRIVAQSFIEGEDAQDGHGHGTHCIGTACGPRQPATLPRYGIAYNAEIYAGKVLSNQGSGPDGGILQGIEWAMRNQCAVVSMSLGAPVTIGQSYSRVFERVARRALAAGTAIIAAAGNESERPGFIMPVGHPANCPSIMAVGAIDAQFQVASFSCGGLNPDGGQVDIAGPGVNIHSSWPRPILHRRLRGTSMATPHVAGIAALIAESDPNARGRAMLQVLAQTARRLNLLSRDVGAGLAQAP
ncbi:S8 family serine peptidase [Azospirillum sp. TSO22-1]|uniref:S8 family peptidase n=1 Tax=Azospirillum sp. TSO22-1 TaxID=716789 RepID=UPI0018EE8F8D|nr:S8 family serine peptidase [Azospirillum sp. TSO22-1]